MGRIFLSETNQFEHSYTGFFLKQKLYTVPNLRTEFHFSAEHLHIRNRGKSASNLKKYTPKMVVTD